MILLVPPPPRFPAVLPLSSPPTWYKQWWHCDGHPFPSQGKTCLKAKLAQMKTERGDAETGPEEGHWWASWIQLCLKQCCSNTIIYGRCLSFFSSNLARATRSREGLFWLTVGGYSSSWWGSQGNRSGKQLVTSHLRQDAKLNDGCPAVQLPCPMCIVQNPRQGIMPPTAGTSSHLTAIKITPRACSDDSRSFRQFPQSSRQQTYYFLWHSLS